MNADPRCGILLHELRPMGTLDARLTHALEKTPSLCVWFAGVPHTRALIFEVSIRPRCFSETPIWQLIANVPAYTACHMYTGSTYEDLGQLLIPSP